MSHWTESSGWQGAIANKTEEEEASCGPALPGAALSERSSCLLSSAGCGLAQASPLDVKEDLRETLRTSQRVQRLPMWRGERVPVICYL